MDGIANPTLTLPVICPSLPTTLRAIGLAPMIGTRPMVLGIGVTHC